MAVYDRWHKSHPTLDEPDPANNDQPCKCGRGKNKLYPTADHQKGDRWQVRYRDPDKPPGKQQVKRNFPIKEGSDPDKHATAFDAKVNADLDDGTYVDPKLGKVTLTTFATKWRSGLVSDLTSQATIDRRLAHIIGRERRPKDRKDYPAPPIAGMSMARLSKSPILLQEWVKALEEEKKLSPGYIKAIVDTLSAIFNAAMENGAASANPTKAKSLKLPEIVKKKIVPWTAEMVETAGVELKRRHGCEDMVYLGTAAALRKSEIFAFAAGDFDLDNEVLHITRQIKALEVDGKTVLIFAPPKGGKERDVPLAPSLAARLEVRVKDVDPVEVTLPWRTPDGEPHTAELLFVRASGDPWFGAAFDDVWQAARKVAGAPASKEQGMHVLRHTCASAWLAGGVDIRALSEWLGHSDPGFTLRTYIHLMPDAGTKGRRAIDTFLAGKQDPDEEIGPRNES